MNIIDTLVEQCRKPKGILGIIMTKVMNVMNAGLINWALQKIKCANGSILEVGCGGGETIYRLSKKYPNCHIEGIDYSIDAVNLSIKKNLISIRSRMVNIQQADVKLLPFPNESFDSILAIRTHYFWELLEESCMELYRLLKTNRELLIFSEEYKIQYHMKEFNTDNTMKELLLRVGFRTVSFERRTNCLCISAVK